MTFSYENQKYKKGFNYVIGCDEVGRGSLAGPVVAAAVVIEHATYNIQQAEIKDSKLLSPEKRRELSEIIKQHAWWSVGVVSQKIIDEINIHNATLLAMQKAILNLQKAYSQELAYSKVCVVIDGKFTVAYLDIPQEAIVDGDNKVLSIAAASIVAKVYRDSLMREHHENYPVYNFAKHKGYGTFYHRQMILKHGLSPLHRLSFCENIAV